MTKATATGAGKKAMSREQVARVTWQLLARYGFESTSMREIASKLGTTTGTLTHYFRNKDELVEFTNAFMYELVTQRLDEAAASAEGNRLWRSVEALLPTRKAHVDNHRVWLSFITSGFGRARLRNRNRKLLAGHLRKIGSIVKADRAARHRQSELAEEEETALLIALTEGLSTLAAVDQKTFSPKRATELARLAFDRIVGTD